MRSGGVIRAVQEVILGVLFFLLSSAAAFGATYYVRLDGSNSNAGLTNSSGGAWRTVDYAADHVSAGDVVRVQAGTYTETVTPGVNGTSSSGLVTLIADGTVYTCKWVLSSNNYIRVIGFRMQYAGSGCSATGYGPVQITGTNTGLEFWNNDLDGGKVDSGGFRITTASSRVHNSIFIGNTIHGGRNDVAYSIRGNHNFVSHSEIYDLSYIMVGGEGAYNRYLNIYSHDLVPAGHPDALMVGYSTSGFTYNVLESWTYLGIPSDPDNKWLWMSNDGSYPDHTNNVIRTNVVHDLGSGGTGCGNGTGWNTYLRSYHNTFVDFDRASANAATRSGHNFLTSSCTNGQFFNEVNYEAWGANAPDPKFVYYTQGGPITLDYNLAYDPEGATYTSLFTTQAHPRYGDPLFTNYAGHDFTLSSPSSPAYHTGGPLTTVASASGTGTTFTVAANSGGFFRGADANLSQYGGQLAPGDLITVGTSTRRIASISGDAITVTTPLTWTNGQPVYFGTSATPDIGAYPYREGGYTLTASYSQVGGTVTVTPSDTNLVRFVVCYEDGIPTTVANASPYTCSVGGGDVSAGVYPMYASKTLFVTAASGEARPGPAAPTGLRVIR